MVYPPQGTSVAILGSANTWTGVQTFRSVTDAASVQVAVFEGDRATPTDNDEAYISLRLSDSVGNQDEQVRITWKATTVLNGATQDADLFFSTLVNNVLTEMLRLDGSTPRLEFLPDGTARLFYSQGAFAFQEATTISAAVGDVNFDAGLNGRFRFNVNNQITRVGNTVVFTADGVSRLSLGETDGVMHDIMTRTLTSSTVENIHSRVNTRTITLPDATIIATYRKVHIAADTFNGTAGGDTETITTAIGLDVDAPVNGGNLTITNPILAARFNGNVALGAGARLIGNATPTGLQVTAAALTVGSLGSIVLPVKTTTGEPTDAQMGNLSGSVLWNEFDNTLNVRDTTVDNPLTVTLAGYLIQSYVPRERAASAWYHPSQVWQGDVWGDGRAVVDETRCPVCGEDIVPQAGPVVFWPNAYRPGSNRHPERLDVHAVFGHLHPEREAYIQQLERRMASLEEKVAA